MKNNATARYILGMPIFVNLFFLSRSLSLRDLPKIPNIMNQLPPYLKPKGLDRDIHQNKKK